MLAARGTAAPPGGCQGLEGLVAMEWIHLRPGLLMLCASAVIAQTVIDVDVLENGDFEKYGPKGVNVDIPADGSEDWIRFQAPGDDNFDLKYNSDIWPQFQGPHEGDNYATVKSESGNRAHVIQVIGGLPPDSTITLSGVIAACSVNDVTNVNHWIVLWNWDGTDADPAEPGNQRPDASFEIGRYDVPDQDKCDPAWLPFSFAGTVPAGGTVTVDFGYNRLGDTLWDIPMTYVDSLELVVPITCPDVYGDADGDGDVDAEDFGEWQRCFTGDAAGRSPECACLDADQNGRIDEDDLAAFEACATGPGIAQPDPGCGAFAACCDPIESTCRDTTPADCLLSGIPQRAGTLASPESARKREANRCLFCCPQFDAPFRWLARQ